MKILWTLALLLFGGSLHAQSTDWNRLESLPEGTQLVVSTGRSLPCALNYIDDFGIECTSRFSIVRIDRTRVVAVSLARSKHTTAIGAVIGAAPGASLAAAKNNSYRTQAALEGALLGGLAGSLVGHIIGLTHGPTIYVRP